ncbi:MAG: hypothetical protein ABH882_03480 [Candidatus Omnitrophota bacterium]|nr:hypothetical protein [Candidatus Omnitrophota bacterium]MBU1929247.1 hypothetical protein [Candidatus Omnitrophota bacterium]MBU2034370.1 hypothetical protein [Candidatus Omnitrophota bacterium]MBU2221555.1 hypothetical protein [Candidatus Omnitrophota bacterium]MBU2258101.1 hypothetical protein [Candidatus Omnitrophota bacterium]
MATETKTQSETAEKPAAEKQTNCLGCNKPLKKIKKYYRNQKFFCSKKCWKKFLKPKEEQK